MKSWWIWGRYSVKWISGLLIGVILACAEAAWGQSCTITTTPASFGAYDIFASGPLDTTGDISVRCDPGVVYTVKLDPGQNANGSYQPRKMRSSAGGSTLDYNLYRDSAYTQVWGDGTDATFTRAGVGTGGTDHIPVYGRATARQNVAAGTYNDLVTIWVEW
jgi:spore coat protein U-like protein